jgi:hypothetical protein
VSGEIRLAGKPVDRAWISFYPVDGTQGDPVFLAADANGRYKTDLAPRGPLAIRVELPASLVSQAPEPLFGRLQILAGNSSPLRHRTGPKPTRFDVDLATVPLDPAPAP